MNALSFGVGGGTTRRAGGTCWLRTTQITAKTHATRCVNTLIRFTIPDKYGLSLKKKETKPKKIETAVETTKMANIEKNTNLIVLISIKLQVFAMSKEHFLSLPNVSGRVQVLQQAGVLSGRLQCHRRISRKSL